MAKILKALRKIIDFRMKFFFVVFPIKFDFFLKYKINACMKRLKRYTKEMKLINGRRKIIEVNRL